MKKLIAIIVLCLIFIGIGYGVGLLTDDYSMLILVAALLALVACIAMIGAIYWLLEYIGKN